LHARVQGQVVDSARPEQTKSKETHFTGTWRNKVLESQTNKAATKADKSIYLDIGYLFFFFIFIIIFFLFFFFFIIIRASNAHSFVSRCYNLNLHSYTHNARCYNLNLLSSNSWRLLHSWANTKQPMRDYGKNQVEKLLQTTCSFLGVRDRDQKIQNISSDLVGG